MNVTHPPSVLVIAGPTASGKSALAMDVAATFDGTVINADAMQVYAELRVLTARPSPADEARVPHRLYGVLPAAERCSAGRWRGLAWAAVEEAWGEGRLPVVAGGTGLYLRALMEGLAPVPAIPEAVRREAAEALAAGGIDGLRRALEPLDPAAAARLRDRQRLQRAYEVVRATGRTLAAWQQAGSEPPPARFVVITLEPPREVLYAAIDARFEAMIEAGAVEEVRALTALGLDPALPAMKAVGVRELGAYLRGEMDLAGAVEAAQRGSRQLAKRQLTWIRHQVSVDLREFAQYSESHKEIIFSFIRRLVLTKGAGATTFPAD